MEKYFHLNPLPSLSHRTLKSPGSQATRQKAGIRYFSPNSHKNSIDSNLRGLSRLSAHKKQVSDKWIPELKSKLMFKYDGHTRRVKVDKLTDKLGIIHERQTNVKSRQRYLMHNANNQENEVWNLSNILQTNYLRQLQNSQSISRNLTPSQPVLTETSQNLARITHMSSSTSRPKPGTSIAMPLYQKNRRIFGRGDSNSHSQNLGILGLNKLSARKSRAGKNPYYESIRKFVSGLNPSTVKSKIPDLESASILDTKSPLRLGKLSYLAKISSLQEEESEYEPPQDETDTNEEAESSRKQITGITIAKKPKKRISELEADSSISKDSNESEDYMSLADEAVEIKKTERAGKIKRNAFINIAKAKKTHKKITVNLDNVDHVVEKQENSNSLFNRKLANGVMKFDNMSLGDNYAIDLAKNLPKTAEIEILSLRNNRFTSRGAIAMLGIVTNKTKKVDISHNPEIKIDAYKFLSKYILTDYKKHLVELNLEGNRIGDIGAEIV